ncbi:MAG: hypothetical protein Q9227_004080 [Pyrenula ochraceoflavens]
MGLLRRQRDLAFENPILYSLAVPGPIFLAVLLFWAISEVPPHQKSDQVERHEPRRYDVNTCFFVHASMNPFVRPNDLISGDMCLPIDRLMLDGRRTHSTNIVTCLPSSGGILVAKDVHSVMLDYIGLDRLHDVPRTSNQTEEDEFCTRMKKVGGVEQFRNVKDLYYTWHYRNQITPRTLIQDEDLAIVHPRGELRLIPKLPRPMVHCWPNGGGVWVKVSDEFGRIEINAQALKNAHTMEEVCEVIRESGGTFYKNPRRCEWTRDMF